MPARRPVDETAELHWLGPAISPEPTLEFLSAVPDDEPFDDPPGRSAFRRGLSSLTPGIAAAALVLACLSGWHAVTGHPSAAPACVEAR